MEFYFLSSLIQWIRKVLIDSLSHYITIDASTGNSKKTELEIAPLSEISDKFCDIFVHLTEC